MPPEPGLLPEQAGFPPSRRRHRCRWHLRDGLPAARGYRRVVASPVPRKIVEIDAVKQLWDSTIVIACGGGGIPVVEKIDGTLEGVAAVIDKDLSAELLAEQVDADILMILTEVENVYINFNKPDQKKLEGASEELRP